jgi:hypothetical protein
MHTVKMTSKAPAVVDASSGPVVEDHEGIETAILVMRYVAIGLPIAFYMSLWMYYTMYQFGFDFNMLWLLVGGLFSVLANAVTWGYFCGAGLKPVRSPDEMLTAWNSGEKVLTYIMIGLAVALIGTAVVYNFVPEGATPPQPPANGGASSLTPAANGSAGASTPAAASS